MNVKKFLDKANECGNEFMIVEVSNFYGMDPYDGMKLAVDNIKNAGFEENF